MYEIEGSKRLSELVFKIRIGEGVYAFFGGELVLEAGELGDVFGGGGNRDGETLFIELVMASPGSLRHVG